MARLKENDLVVQRENEELAQVEAQIAELQACRDLILQRRDGAVAAGTELKSSARQILKAATEKKRALAERKLIRARWQVDIDVGTAQYNLVPPAASGLSRPRSCAGHLRSEDPEGATPAGLEVAAGPVAHRSVALSAGPFEQGAQPLRPSRAALDKRRTFDRGYVCVAIGMAELY
ncbi:unnamed protein product [Prunus brigantina]